MTLLATIFLGVSAILIVSAIENSSISEIVNTISTGQLNKIGVSEPSIPKKETSGVLDTSTIRYTL